MKKKITDEQIIIVLEQHKDFMGTWHEFADLMNEILGLDLDESAYRKPIQSYEKITKALGLGDETNSEKLRITQLQKELRINKKQKEVQFYAKAFNKVKNEVYALDKLTDIVKNSVKPFQKPKLDFVDNDVLDFKTTIFMISDMQEDGSGFSHKVFERVEKEIIKRIKEENLKKIIILENGDGIDGILRVASLYENPGGYVQQLGNYQQALSKLLNNIGKKCQVLFSIVNSNHTEIRPFGASRGQIKDEDVTYLILSYLKASLVNNKNIIFVQNPQTPKDLNYNILEVAGYKIFQHHGDNKGSSPKNAENYYNKIMRFYDRNIDFILVAHYHHFCFKTINRLENGGESFVLHSPALDPRQHKSNEAELMLSSEPAFLRLEITKGKGLTKLESIKTGVYL